MLALDLRDGKDDARRRGRQGFEVDGAAVIATVGCVEGALSGWTILGVGDNEQLGPRVG